MTMLRIWMLATAVILAALAIWAFAPVLVFVGLLALGLGIVSFTMIGLAQALKAWSERSQGK